MFFGVFGEFRFGICGADEEYFAAFADSGHDIHKIVGMRLDIAIAYRIGFMVQIFFSVLRSYRSDLLASKVKMNDIGASMVQPD